MRVEETLFQDDFPYMLLEIMNSYNVLCMHYVPDCYTQHVSQSTSEIILLIFYQFLRTWLRWSRPRRQLKAKGNQRNAQVFYRIKLPNNSYCIIKRLVGFSWLKSHKPPY